MLNRLQHNTKIEVRIHDGDFPEEKGVDAKLVRLARNLNAKLSPTITTSPRSPVCKASLRQPPRDRPPHEGCAHSRRNHPAQGRPRRPRQGPGHRLPAGRHHGHRQQRPAHKSARPSSAHVQSTVQTGAGVLVFAEVKRQNGK
jgi:hypothetical protein